MAKPGGETRWQDPGMRHLVPPRTVESSISLVNPTAPCCEMSCSLPRHQCSIEGRVGPHKRGEEDDAQVRAKNELRVPQNTRATRLSAVPMSVHVCVALGIVRCPGCRATRRETRVCHRTRGCTSESVRTVSYRSLTPHAAPSPWERAAAYTYNANSRASRSSPCPTSDVWKLSAPFSGTPNARSPCAQEDALEKDLRAFLI